MKLEAEGQRAIVDPQSSQIESAVSLLSLPDRTFLILRRSPKSYIQAAIVGANRLLLEYRDGSAEKHFRSIRDDYSSGEVVAILEAYRRGEDSWCNENEWRRIDVSPRRDRWDSVSRFCMFAGLLLMFDAAFAFKRADRDAIFGLEAMDALAVAVVVSMVSAIIDLRGFRTMDAIEKVRNVGVIGVGLLVVAIQLIEHLRAR
jgi:hypothetical protein